MKIGRSRVFLPCCSIVIALGLNLAVLHSDAPDTVEVLVKCEGGPSGALAQAADAAVGATTIRRFEAIGWYWVRLPTGVSLAEGLARYRAQPGVLNVEPNRTLRSPSVPTPFPETGTTEEPRIRPQSEDLAPIVPDDPRYRSQWNLKKIGMEQAWATTTG
ncbi:MAG TPA: hypothetical protein PLX89_25450, partial [Verrucomicrobiota bacterium]|nr:hypothetical protein [Verrucomicrobiota bacterium]